MESNTQLRLFSDSSLESSMRYNTYDQMFAESGGGYCGCCRGHNTNSEIVPVAAMGVLAGIAVYLAGQLGMMMDMMDAGATTTFKKKRGRLKSNGNLLDISSAEFLKHKLDGT